ncbi:MAG: tRNA pseudouridine(54/55) synthase Pus10 [Candidatus Aenigmatarchaeota archaeon]
MILEIAKEILNKGYVCDNCLGRQFAQLLSGMTNKERGNSIRTILAMEYSLKPFPIEKSNFIGYKFRKDRPTEYKKPKCVVCDGFFDKMDRFSEQAIKKLKGVDFSTFVVSTIMSSSLIRKEENLWEEIGIEYCEPMKSEINREVGKIIEKKTGKSADEKNPDVTIIIDLENNMPEIRINPVYIYGKYKKLVRGIPQTKWERYKETVEDIIAHPFMRETLGSGHSLHASGREDIDARCLDWRPFVLEIYSPKKRKADLKKMEVEINRTGKVMVSSLRYSNRQEVIKVKSLMPDKTYRVVAIPEKPIDRQELEKLKNLSVIKQQTPTRVLHRRADKTRTKRVKSVSWKFLPKNRIEFKIKAEAGLYIKELVTGDGGRTKPSFSEILNTKINVEELDVIRIHLKGFK